MQEKRLTGKTAVVTGAHTAIGEAIVTKFASEGARVAFYGCCEESGDRILGSVKGAGGEGLLGSVKGTGGEGLFKRVNASNQDEVEAFFSEVSDAFGDIDILVTIPIVSQNKPFIELTESDWVELMEYDGLGSIYAIWETLPFMKKNMGGSIVNLTSLYGSEAGVNVAFNAYFMAGMQNITRCLSMEYAPWGIRANALAYGLIATEGEEPTKEEVFQIMGDDSLRRAGTPDEVANAVLWLASDEASFVTGAVINVNGGVVSRSMETRTWQTGETEFLRAFEREFGE